MTLSPHRQAILIFGIAIPLALIIAVSFVTYLGHTKLQESFQTKAESLLRYEAIQAQVAEEEAFLSKDKRRDKAAYWKSKLEQDVIESFSKNLDTILAKYDPKILRQTEMGQAAGVDSIGSNAKHPNTRMLLGFEGGFKPMQLLLAELESEMPQLVLESISITPKSVTPGEETGALTFSVVYLCWEKAKPNPVQP